MIKKVLSLFFLCIVWQISFAQSVRTHWIDSVFSELSSSDKIGQLFMVPVSGSTDEATIREIESLIESHEIGGLIFKNIHPLQQVMLANHFQSIARVPLLIATEGTLATALDSALNYPPPFVLGAVQNDTLLYELGATVAKQLKAVGVNVFFSPGTNVAAEGTDPSPDPNSLGQDKSQVARKAVAIMRGLQDNGILACAQYYPLNGITVLDIRKNIPVLDMKADSVQTYPFASLIDHGLRGIAPAAAEFPIFYKDVSLAKKASYTSGSLSSLFTAEWIEKHHDYQGLIFVDIGSISNLHEKQKVGDTEMLAFQKGNDILVNPSDIGPAIRRIKKLLRKEDDYEEQLDNTVKRILASKFDAGLWEGKLVNTDNLNSRIHRPQAEVLRQKLYENAITVVRNEGAAVPIGLLDGKSFSYISTYSDPGNYDFYEYLKRYVDIGFETIEDKTDERELLRKLGKTDVVIVGVFPETSLSRIERLDRVLQSLSIKPTIIFCDFGNPFIWSIGPKYQGMITAFTSVADTHKAVPEVLFGAISARGRMAYSPSIRYPAGSGETTKHLDRLAYALPEAAGMNSRILVGIDSIAREAIQMRATPGCQVLVARKGKIVFEKNYGSLTYENKLPVTSGTIYDLASVTKVMATLQTAMFMHERGLIDLHKKVSYYLPELRKTNKKDITIVDMLTHQAGLLPFLPLYPLTMKDTSYLPEYYSHTKTVKYPMQVGDRLFASPVLRDSVWSWILKSRMLEKPARTPYAYKYSDFGFLILQRLAEKILNQPMEDFLGQNLYEPLGSYTMGFNPLTRFQKQLIAPTEDDKIYRKSFVSGTVHDERAAMMGGVAGHAGLFSTANDLAKVAQMLLQEGNYGGVQYYKPETVRLFTAKKYRNSRRGIGWDKPIPSDPGTLTSFYASPRTFGHTGFTGTCVWIDPEFDLVYIFLSNRVYPDRNNKLSNANIRSRIQDVIYKSIFEFVEEESSVNISNQLAIIDGASRP